MVRARASYRPPQREIPLLAAAGGNLQTFAGGAEADGGGEEGAGSDEVTGSRRGEQQVDFGRREAGSSCGCGSDDSCVARVATGSTWRRRSFIGGQGGPMVTHRVEGRATTIQTWFPEAECAAGAFSPLQNEGKSGLLTGPDHFRLPRAAASGGRMEGMEAVQRRAAHGRTAAQVGGTLAGQRIQQTVVEAAATDAQRLIICRPSSGERGGRGGRGGGRGCGRRGRGGGDGHDRWQVLVATRLAAARRLQCAMRQMLAQRQGAAAAISSQVARTARVEAMSAVAEGAMTQAVTNAVAEAEERFRDWATAQRASAATVQREMAQRLGEVERALVEAASAREAAEAAREKAEAGKAAVEAECRGLEAALVQLMARAELESQREERVGAGEAATGMHRLVVVEEEPGEVDVATQTEIVAEVSVSSQTEAELEAAVQTCGMQAAGCEMVVGRQLHPAQAEAVARAEQAAEQLERLREQAEVAAARYRMADDAAEVQSAEATAQKAAQASKVATPTGGRQRRKQHVRRQAAAAGMDVLSWIVSGRQQQGDAEVASRAEVQRALEQRLDVAHEQWMRRQRHASVGDERTGEAEASRRFWQAAQASGINLLDAPD